MTSLPTAFNEIRIVLVFVLVCGSYTAVGASRSVSEHGLCIMLRLTEDIVVCGDVDIQGFAISTLSCTCQDDRRQQ